MKEHMEQPVTEDVSLRSPGSEPLRAGLIHFGLQDLDPKTETHSIDPVAVLVCHGMGQQVRYETISSIAQAIRTEAAKRNTPLEPIEVHLTQANDDFLARAELKWVDEKQQQHEVHVYEAYWAPLTEGRVSYRDTLRFLFAAAWNGLRYSKPFLSSTFDRWMFNGRKPMLIGGKTFFGLLCVLAFLLLQIGIIGYVSLEIAHRLRDVWSQPIPALTSMDFVHAWLEWLAPLFPAGTSTLLHPFRFGLASWWVALLRVTAWLGLIAEALFVRYFIIEYVGDVAAYVSPYKDSKFDELRHQIQKRGLDVGKVIYGFGDTLATIPEYGKVVVVGHSLGSVLAYDTLNALINLDNVSAASESRHVVKRTPALITFGSPLDKTAFIFRMQPSNEQDWIREQLAASVQPLIVSYPLFRPATFNWVNIWSPMDIISGELNYYDDPAILSDLPPHVVNMPDGEAWKPLLAHVQYWNNRLLREQLYKYVS